jgi:hypothetical protein
MVDVVCLPGGLRTEGLDAHFRVNGWRARPDEAKAKY